MTRNAWLLERIAFVLDHLISKIVAGFALGSFLGDLLELWLLASIHGQTVENTEYAAYTAGILLMLLLLFVGEWIERWCDSYVRRLESAAEG